ncbi:MAG: HlyC/CorC family transporter [Planctomycetes bacterium]|nr:HlyC/CorC family transporter [Planctomycetota bacterium]
MFVFVAAVSVALVVSFLCSVFESVLLSLGYAQVAAMEREGRPAGRILNRFKRNIDVPIAAILIANTVAHTVGSAVAGASYGKVFDEDTLWIFTVVFTVAVLLLTEIIPKTWGVSKARYLATPVAYGIQALTIALRPFVFVSERISRSLRGGSNDPITSIEEIRFLAALGGSEGAVGKRTARMIVGATRLQELSARHVMVPRRMTSILTGSRSRDQVLDTLRRSRHSRFPFSPDGEMDNVSGIILAKELLFQIQERPNEDIEWSSLLREALRVPGSMPLNDLLRTFQESHRHMAIVIDEFGGVDGIVTLEDVLEEIVGEIVDESDRPPEESTQQPDGSIHVDAVLEMRKLSRLLEVDWDASSEITSLSGLLSEQLGRLPREGDEVDWKGFRFRVLTANARRPKKIAIERHPQ